MSWTAIQLAAVGNGFGFNVNGAGAKVDGAEVAATLRPTAGLVASVSVAINDAKLSGDTDPLAVGAVKSDRLPFTPQYAVSANADYRWNFGTGLAASIVGSLRSLSRQTGTLDTAFSVAFGPFPPVKLFYVV